MSSNLIFCKACCMDGSAQEIVLDENGICNFCHQAQRAKLASEIDKPNLQKYIDRIKADGKQYDCVIGLSGGVDSSMVLHHAIKMGLRPLCFSMDNGWNDPKADENIMNLVETLKVPFYRYVLDIPKFKELQAAFIAGGVKNLEATTDHVLFAATYEVARKYNIKWVLSGGNWQTESIMPASWGEDARDLFWIKSVFRKMMGKKLKGIPMLPLWKEQYYRLWKQIKFFQPLNYLDYNREASLKLLKEKYHYKPYGEKHCENTFTWWFQNFYLYEKFGIDKRKAHLASLINSRQLTRSEAMKELAKRPIYPELGIEERVLRYPKQEFPNSMWIRKWVIWVYQFIPKAWK